MMRPSLATKVSSSELSSSILFYRNPLLCVVFEFCTGEIFSLFLGGSTQYLDVLISTKMMKILGGWQCVDCSKEYKQKGDLSRHVESSHIDHPGCVCSLCGKILKTRDSLRNHYYQSHRQ